MNISILIPAHNEEASITETIVNIVQTLNKENILHEVLVVNDNSTDQTESVLKGLCSQYTTLRYVNNQPPNGIGLAIQKGLEIYDGDAVAIVMADGSDDPADIVRYYRELEKGFECVFGSRFIKNAKVIDYPLHKLILNRLANRLIKVLFAVSLNDTTNAFKCYRRAVIDGIRPILSHHFNITVELPLKAIVRGYTYSIIPINWSTRKTGISKLKIKEMGSRYLFIVLYVFLEKLLTRGDYNRR